MGMQSNSSAGLDPQIIRFDSYLSGERNASRHTRAGYLADLTQFVAHKWGAEAAPPYDWNSVGESDARAFLLRFTAEGSGAATLRRKLASMRSFFNFLRLESEGGSENPFSSFGFWVRLCESDGS